MSGFHKVFKRAREKRDNFDHIQRICHQNKQGHFWKNAECWWKVVVWQNKIQYNGQTFTFSKDQGLKERLPHFHNLGSGINLEIHKLSLFFPYEKNVHHHNLSYIFWKIKMFEQKKIWLNFSSLRETYYILTRDLCCEHMYIYAFCFLLLSLINYSCQMRSASFLRFYLKTHLFVQWIEGHNQKHTFTTINISTKPIYSSCKENGLQTSPYSLSVTLSHDRIS